VPAALVAQVRYLLLAKKKIGASTNWPTLPKKKNKNRKLYRLAFFPRAGPLLATNLRSYSINRPARSSHAPLVLVSFLLEDSPCLRGPVNRHECAGQVPDTREWAHSIWAASDCCGREPRIIGAALREFFSGTLNVRKCGRRPGYWDIQNPRPSAATTAI